MNEIYDIHELFRMITDSSPKEDLQVNGILSTCKYDNIYISSDMHFLKDYDIVDDLMIKMHNNVFRSNNSNKIYINLGDIGCKEILACKELLKEKICALNKGKYNILIRGNHDVFEDEFYHDCGFDIVILGPLKFKNLIFSHIPIDINNANTEEDCINIHGHMHQYPIIDNIKRCLVYTRQMPYSPINLYQVLSLSS